MKRILVRKNPPDMTAFDRALADNRKAEAKIKALTVALELCADTLTKRGMPSQIEMLDAARKARAILKSIES